MKRKVTVKRPIFKPEATDNLRRQM